MRRWWVTTEPFVTGDEVSPTELAIAMATLREVHAPELRLEEAPVRLSGGYWAEMWVLSLKETGSMLPARVVLRLAPDAEASIRETAIQRAVAELGYTTPAILASGGATPTTRAWSVMTHATGHQLLAGLSGLGALTRLPRLAKSLPRQLAVSMAALHALDAMSVEVALAALSQSSGGEPVRPGIDGMLDRFATQAAQLEVPRLSEAVNRLAASAPVESKRVICHGDLHPFNILDDNGTITVLDWTTALVADPAFDVSYTEMLLVNAPLKAPRLVQPIINAAARAIARRFISQYRKASGALSPDDERMVWYTRLHATRIALEIAEWRSSGTVGENVGHPWLSLEPMVERLLRAT